MGAHKILIHVSDRDKWSSAVKMAAACITSDAGDAVEIVLLADAFAGAVFLASDPNLQFWMEELCEAGHRILVCERCMRNLNLRPESLPDFMERVPTGILEIVRLQDAGFHYIKV